MPEQTLVEAAPSAAAVDPSPSLEIPRSNTPEYQQWRETGNLPDKTQPKTEAPATSDAPKETTSEAVKPETAAAPESAKTTQESRRKPDAEARIKELTDKANRLEKELVEARTKPQAESAPAKPQAQPQTYQEWRKTFKATDWVNDYAKANPDASYEEATAAMADHLGDVRDQFRVAEAARESQAKTLHGKVAEAKARYENFNETVSPFIDRFVSEDAISPLVKSMVNDSDVFADLAFTLAGDAKFMEVAKDPGKAIRYIANVERLIQEELSSGKSSTRGDDGRFAKTEPETPVKRGPESAPAPPLEIGSRGTGSMDESDRALQAIERGDGRAVSAFMDAENRKDLARRRGV